MGKIKWLAAVVLPLVLVTFLQSQSVADLAKKEKERRAALKGKPSTVITTADIAKVKKRPAVEATSQEEAAAGGAEAAHVEGQAQGAQPRPARPETPRPSSLPSRPSQTAGPPLDSRPYRSKNTRPSWPSSSRPPRTSRRWSTS